jgi:hypothetical protein
MFNIDSWVRAEVWEARRTEAPGRVCGVRRP